MRFGVGLKSRTHAQFHSPRLIFTFNGQRVLLFLRFILGKSAGMVSLTLESSIDQPPMLVNIGRPQNERRDHAVSEFARHL
jgi:hypothetical protein